MPLFLTDSRLRDVRGTDGDFHDSEFLPNLGDALMIQNVVCLWLGWLALGALHAPPLFADLPKPAVAERAKTSSPAPREPGGPLSVEKLTEMVRKSVVVVSFTGRDHKTLGLGSGFVISEDGLIATNLHVLGEARPIFVQTAEGKRHPVTEIHATDQAMDLAILKIAAKNLTPLPLGDSASLQQGEDVVALGNPQGLTFSVVKGVVSGRREIDGKPMLQLAIPIEQGNSGGPLLDRFGRVHGILTMKSAGHAEPGFCRREQRPQTAHRKTQPDPPFPVADHRHARFQRMANPVRGQLAAAGGTDSGRRPGRRLRRAFAGFANAKAAPGAV